MTAIHAVIVAFRPWLLPILMIAIAIEMFISGSGRRDCEQNAAVLHHIPEAAGYRACRGTNISTLSGSRQKLLEPGPASG
jgi:hypothetical protein